jgi:hypothetical protein
MVAAQASLKTATDAYYNATKAYTDYHHYTYGGINKANVIDEGSRDAV